MTAKKKPPVFGTWKVTIVGGRTVLARTTTLTVATGTARAQALSGWAAFITRLPQSKQEVPTKIEVTTTLDVIVCQGDPTAPWIQQVRTILAGNREGASP